MTFARQLRSRPAGRSLLNTAMLAFFCHACGSGAAVERSREDVVETGRRIPRAAYAWYGRAVNAESRGRQDEAQRAYEEVLRLDPTSGAAWAGLASLHCVAEKPQAERLFAKGLQRADELAPVHLARAQCALAWRQPKQAARDARRALELDPWSREANSALVLALHRLGRNEAAQRWLASGMLFYRQRVAPQQVPQRDAIISALARADLTEARHQAAGRIDPGELASWALAWGRQELARQQAKLVLAADPDNGDAWVVTLVSSSPSWEPDLLRAAPRGARLSPVARCLLLQHLQVLTGAPLAELQVCRTLCQLEQPFPQPAEKG